VSKHETWRTRKYWDQTGGLLIEEFVVVNQTKIQGRRVIDGIVVLNENKAIHKGNTYNLADRDVVIIQTKNGRIGMSLLGQAYFSRFLIERMKPRSIQCVAICGKTDAVMEELAKQHNIEIVEMRF
jgi:hypothetical protein